MELTQRDNEQNASIEIVEEEMSIREELRQQLQPIVSRLDAIESTLEDVARKADVYTKQEMDAIVQKKEEKYRKELDDTHKRMEGFINKFGEHSQDLINGLIDNIAQVAKKVETIADLHTEAAKNIQNLRDTVEKRSKASDERFSKMADMIEKNAESIKISREEVQEWKEITKDGRKEMAIVKEEMASIREENKFISSEYGDMNTRMALLVDGFNTIKEKFPIFEAYVETSIAEAAYRRRILGFFFNSKPGAALIAVILGFIGASNNNINQIVQLILGSQ